MKIEIKKAKIKGSLMLAYDYTQHVGDVYNTISTNSDAPMHEDLQGLFLRLIPHFALVCEEGFQKESEQWIEGKVTPEFDDAIVKKFGITGFSIGGSEDNEGVVILGKKHLSNEKVINLVSPFVKFNDGDNYKYCKELQRLIEELQEEVYLYMEGKQAPRPKQLAMDFEDEEKEAFIYKEDEGEI